MVRPCLSASTPSPIPAQKPAAPFWDFGPALAANLPFGVLMVGAYAWRRDLVANAAAHTALLLITMAP